MRYLGHTTGMRDGLHVVHILEQVASNGLCHAGQHLIDWSPFEDPSSPMDVLCPLCGGYGEQKCLNCIGAGTVAPLKGAAA